MHEHFDFDDCLKVEEVHDIYGNNLETGCRNDRSRKHNIISEYHKGIGILVV